MYRIMLPVPLLAAMLLAFAAGCTAQLPFPYHGTSSTTSPMFWITQNGTGYAGRFTTAGGLYGLLGESSRSNGNGLRGVADMGAASAGVFGQSVNGRGVVGLSTKGEAGVKGKADKVGGYGVWGQANNGLNARGVFGSSNNGYGGYFTSDFHYGLFAGSDETTALYAKTLSADGAVYAQNGSNGSEAVLADDLTAVQGISRANGGTGVRGIARTGFSAVGVEGSSDDGYGGWFTSITGTGVGVEVQDRSPCISVHNAFGSTSARIGGETTGVRGDSPRANGIGVFGEADTGPNAWAVGGTSVEGYAGRFAGKVHVTGTLTKGGGAFKIDHPLDPERRYLQHSFVESPDMKNVYDGVVVLDASGEATVQLPAYFEALNRDFRYQLTCIGAFAPVYIAQKISGNTFRIAGGTAGMEVSWQVTGIRQDAWAEANRVQVEVDKPVEEQGRYAHPEVFGQPRSMSIESVHHPEVFKDR